MQLNVQEPPSVQRGFIPATLSRGQILVFGVLGMALFTSLFFPSVKETTGPLGVLVGYGATGVVLLRRIGTMRGREKRAWTLVGIGFLVAATGIALVAIIQEVTGSIGAFGPTDVAFILAYVFVVSGFGSLPHFPITLSQRLRVYLDSLIGALSMGVIMWVVALRDLIHQFDQASLWDRWAGTAYPIVDVAALMVVVIVSVRRSSFRFDPRLVLFAGGIVLQSAADLNLLTTGIGKDFAEAQPNFPVFVMATILYFSAAVIVDRRPKARAYADRRTPVWAILAPYSVALAMLALLIVETSAVNLSTDVQVLLTGTYIVGALVIIRQGVAIRENRLQVDKQRAELVSSISHELRTPLTAIVGFLDVMTDEQSGIGEEEQRELTGVIHEQARHMSTIVSDLILLARGSPDEMTLKEEVVAVAPVITNAIHSVRHTNVAVDAEIGQGLEARIDAGRVQQILINLFTNAVRYGEGKSLIVVRREDSNLAIEVHDNGPGVPKRYEAAIWERFERGANRLNASTPGSGIGLAVVDAITQAHGGSTAYRHSERLGGACFRVVLPDRIVVG